MKEGEWGFQEVQEMVNEVGLGFWQVMVNEVGWGF